MNQKLQKYDILAVQPQSEKAFQVACSQFDVDIISLEMGTRLPFYIKATTVNQAIQRGIYFEVSYGPMVRDSNARRHLITNTLSLVRVTKGKNIILSSEANRAMNIRGPHDLINLCHLFGVSNDIARNWISTNCRSVLFHAATRRHTHKGLASVEPVDVLTEKDQWKRGDKPDQAELSADFMSFPSFAEDEMMDDEDAEDNDMDEDH
ncbi:Ribonuclease P protein subunit p30 [Chytridiales sp. JEL 0842]|nr:Ribonuclease P protein subunit p30 [Chytridiales sp. JEL 0842]